MSPRFVNPSDPEGRIPFIADTRFNPYLLSGLTGYLDPRSLSAGLIATTPNLGSNAGTWLQPVSGSQPTVDLTGGNTGGPCIVWDGNRSLYSSLASTAWSFMHATNCTIYSVFRITANPNKQFVIGPCTAQKSVSASTPGLIVFGDDRAGSGYNDKIGHQVKNNAGAIADYFGANGTLPDQTWYVLETVVTAGVGISTYRNGTLVQTTAFTGAQYSGAPQFTCYLFSGGAGGFIGKSTQVLIYNVAHTAAERSWMRRQLGTLNNITVVA